MATYRCWAGSGVTERANSTAYALGARMQPLITDASTNHAVAKRYVWECTTAGTSGGAVPAWSASYTVDSSTITDGTVTWTCRAPGYSSGSTVDWSFASRRVLFTASLLASDDTLLVHYTSQEASHSTGATTTFASNVKVIAVDKDSSEAYTPMSSSGYIGNANSNTQGISIATARVLMRGITIRHAVANTYTLAVGDDGNLNAVDLRLEASSASSACRFTISGTADQRSYARITSLAYSTSQAGQQMQLAGAGEINGLSIVGTGAVTTLFSTATTADATGSYWTVSAMDATNTSAISSSATLVADGGITSGRIDFHDCVLPSSYTVFSGAANVNDSGLIVRFKNCKAGSTVGIHGYYSALGSATANTTITYNGEALSWKIDASANATRAGPFVLPWMWGQIPTGASLTPKIEILRNDSTTALTDAQVWCESEVGVTASSPLRTYASSEAAYTSSGTNIPTGAGLSSWAGESGTAWSGKLQTGAVTPTEDEAAMRICVATTATIYAAMGWDT